MGKPFGAWTEWAHGRILGYSKEIAPLFEFENRPLFASTPVPPVSDGKVEPVAWIAPDDIHRLEYPRTTSGLYQLANFEACDPLGYCTIPLYASPPARHSDEEVERLRAALEVIDRKAEAGLCYFTLESARAFHQDIRDIVAEARAALQRDAQGGGDAGTA